MALIDLTNFESDENYTDFLTRLGDALGFDHASYATTSLITGDIHGFTSYPEEWELHYAKMGMQRFDPTLRAAMLSVAPVDWQRLAKTDDFTRVFFDAHDFGITDRGLILTRWLLYLGNPDATDPSELPSKPDKESAKVYTTW
ncbi:MAG: autoinducer binding domain-containing protein, partial [Pseudomonadota bacterium]|nr:autoinducer binding domain-containing protein [Pseudomonadota bacterium]